MKNDTKRSVEQDKKYKRISKRYENMELRRLAR